MKDIDKRRMLEATLAIILIGGVLFIAINTAEAKKLLGYVITVLTPFIYGFCMAFILNLLVKQIEGIFKALSKKKKKPLKPKGMRVWAIIISILVFVAFVSLTIGTVIPNLKDTATSLYRQAPGLWKKFMAFLEELGKKYPVLSEYIDKLVSSLEGLVEKLLSWIKGNVSNILSGALTTIKSATGIIFNLGIGLVIAFAMLVYKEKLVKEVYMIMERILSPKLYRYFCYVQELANKKFQIYIKFNFIQALITGAGTFLFMLITGMPYKASIALLITVTQLVPIVGAIAGTALGAILILPTSWIKAILFVALSILVQQLVEKLINPHLMGKELEMPGILTFLAVVLGGKQFGLIGLVCAVPVVSVVFDIYTIKLRPRMKKAKAQKEEKQKEAAD